MTDTPSSTLPCNGKLRFAFTRVDSLRKTDYYDKGTWDLKTKETYAFLSLNSKFFKLNFKKDTFK